MRKRFYDHIHAAYPDHQLPRAVAVVQARLNDEMLVAHPVDYRLMHMGREGPAEIMKLPLGDASTLPQLCLDFTAKPRRHPAILIFYTRVAKRMNIPKPVYWMTMIAGGFLLMSIFAVSG